ncbi:MAG TPA: HAMP domain-containing sensor histidine kinase [Cytophagaceae bacterium]|nr:HAMP domain-containing sensor histidine kinase [Cytophagaceae bacterium]
MKTSLKYYHYLILSVFLASASLLIWYFAVYKEPSKGYETYTHYISEKIHHELKISEDDMVIISHQYIDHKGDLSSLLQLKFKYPFFIFKDDTLIYWSENKFIPKYSLLPGKEKNKFIQLPIGKFIVSQREIENGYKVFSCIPLSYEYSIENNYISSGLNEEIFTHENIGINNFHTPGSYAVYSSEHKYLFSLDFDVASTVVNDSILYLIIILSAMSLLMLLVGLLYAVNGLVKKSHLLSATLLLFFSLSFIRGGMLLLQYPFSIVDFKLFNPKYFASSEISPSLGDLFLNIVFFSIFSWFILNNYYKSKLLKEILLQRKSYGFIYSILFSITSLIVLLYLSYVFLDVYSNSQFSLDITKSIRVNHLKVVGYLILMLASGIYFIYNHIVLRLYMYMIGSRRSIQSYLPIILVSLFFQVVMIILGINNWILIPVNLLYWLVLIFFSLPSNLGTLKYSTYLYFLFAAFICAFTGAINLYYVNADKNIAEKHKYASQLLNENDVFAEYLLSESMDIISHDKFIINRMKSFFSSKDLIEQKIKKVILPDYLDKYEVHVSVFDYDGDALLKNSEYSNYYETLAMYSNDSLTTDYKNIFFINEKMDSPLKRYIAFREIYDHGILIGSVILELVHKKNSPNSVYPELLVDKKFITPQQYNNYQYAIYDDKLLMSKGYFNYEKYFDESALLKKDLYLEGMVINEYHHLGIESEDGKIVIISNEEYSIKNILSNFSFLFFLLLVFVLLFIGGYIYYFQYRKVQLNYATKILVYLNIAFFLPLFIVSIVTLSLISNYYKTSQYKSFVKKAENLSNNILAHLESYQDDPYWETRLESDIAQLADFTDSDINLYNPKGELLYSYHPAIFERNLLSRQLNPEAYINIAKGGATEIMLNESLGSLHYNAVYMPIKSYRTGELLGILNIPFFESRQELSEQLIGILTTTLNIFSIIFLMFAGLSYFASRVLTTPLNIITQKIRKTTFGDNKPLDWNSKDEIGLLISEYNSMLLKLEHNRIALSRSEKESAWREMAKQVAHEIKNPLTPMKLKIQHLQRSWNEKNPLAEEQTIKGLQSLLDQVNILSEIASSFAIFAKMPIPKNELFDVGEVLKSTVNLYNNTHDVRVDIKVEKGNFMIEGDEQLMGSIFTNLIINAIQSVPYERKPEVGFSLSKADGKVLIEIKDNGMGIPDAIRDKVFLPNFSTKETGSGIGLAVAKRGVEHAGGRIWFETKTGEGTSFFIEIPLVN